MKHPFRWIALGVGVVVVAFAVILAVNVGTDPRAELNTSRLLGKAAPEFTLTRLDGSKLTLADLAGKTVIVNFWNSWCVPCRDELPALKTWYDGMEWAVANDHGAEAAALAYGTRGQPESFAISPNGQVVGSIIGPMTTADLDQMARAGRGL